MEKISTRNLVGLPSVPVLRKLLQSLAVLDAILSPEWGSRYYSFQSNWAPDEEMGSMRNGSGDEFYALFNPAGCFIKGFAHEYPMTPYRVSPPQIWPGVLDTVPDEFASAAAEPAFSMSDTTFCIWKRLSDSSWGHGPVSFPKHSDPDGSEYLLRMLDGNPDTYREFADGYFEIELPIESIQLIYQHAPLTEDLVRSLNSEVSLSQLKDDLIEIGYPSTAD